MSQAYEAVIGLECHVQLATHSKMFCGCPTDYAGAAPNTHVCPICLGMPGVLPVINRIAVEYTLLTGLAMNSAIPEATKFDRKNYPYPDLVKGYQISQYDLPLVKGGWIEITTPGSPEPRRIRLERVHLEEDNGKLTHVTGGSLVDFNRSGVPLMEIVSQPDLRSPAEARAYLLKLRAILRTLGVSDADMEKGQLRCDVNVSLRPVGQQELGTKVEVKNLNSFRFLVKALEHEIERHIGVIESGGKIVQETRLWHQAEGYTVSMRSKEKAHDYRYFPEPDLLPVQVSAVWREAVRTALPELPAAKRNRFVASYGVTPYDAGVLTDSTDLARYFEETVKAGAPGKAAANWMQTELLRRLNDSGKEITASPVSPKALAELIRLVEGGKITGAVAKKVFPRMFEDGRGAAQIVEAEGLGAQVSSDSLDQIAREVTDKNPDNVAKYKSGNEGVFKFFVGQVMKGTRGQANPQAVNEVLKKLLG